MAGLKKILIVDDDPTTLKILSVRLRINGYEVLTATNGEEGLQKAKSENPDLLLLDLMLPKINGYQVCRMLKFDDKFKRIPIIILSALHEKKEHDKAVEAGADGVLLKPFDLELLLSKIKDSLG